MEALSCLEYTLITLWWLSQCRPSSARTTSPIISLPVWYRVGVIHKRHLHELWKVEVKQQVTCAHPADMGQSVLTSSLLRLSTDLITLISTHFFQLKHLST